MKAVTIDEVIDRITVVTKEAKAKNDPLGIFALVYLGVTVSVKQAINDGFFDDPVRMERLDVIFANRYLDALDCYSSGRPCSLAWKTAFDAATNTDLLVIQHLLMGMNAHINLDLGIAAAETMPPNELGLLVGDFNKINQLLLAKVDDVQDKLSGVSPLFFLLDWFGKRRDEQFAEFSLVRSRDNAWKAANRLSILSPNAKGLEINELDNYVALINRLISKPGFLVRTVVKLIKWLEEKDIAKVMDKLAHV